jgi:chlorite dismutase
VRLFFRCARAKKFSKPAYSRFRKRRIVQFSARFERRPNFAYFRESIRASRSLQIVSQNADFLEIVLVESVPQIQEVALAESKVLRKDFGNPKIVLFLTPLRAAAFVF